MGTGWRRALCSTLPKDPDSTTSSSSDEQPGSPTTLAKCTTLRFFSNPSTSRLNKTQAPQAVSTPTLRCRTVAEAAHVANNTAEESPKLQCKTKPAILKSAKSPRTFLGSYSTPSSPRSPLKLSLFKNSFKFRSGCSICSNSLKAGQGTAIYTAECGHGFHFACVASLVRGARSGSLACPVCNAAWKEIPLLAIHKSANKEEDNSVVEDKKVLIQSSLPRTPNSARSGSRYDDDEPLSSPRFIPIPESDEAGEVEEFQGFFANSKATHVEFTLSPESAVVSASKSHETRVVALRVKAPPAPRPRGSACSRAPVDLVAVLDVSGSMSGAKLQMLKRAVLLVISSLGSADRLAIVAFSASARRLLPLRRMTARGQSAAREIVGRLACGQGTSVGDALRKATKVLEDRRERNPVASIVLLSDGQHERARHDSDANQRQPRSHESSTRFAHVEIPVHATGLGEERAAGGGRGCRREPADDAFAKCVGGLLSVVVRDLRIQLGFAAGSAPAEIAAVYSASGRPRLVGSGSVRLGDLYAEEERELLVELRVPASAVGSRHVLTVECSYKDPSTKEDVYGGDRALTVPKMEALGSEDAKIGRLRNLFVVTRSLAESRRLVEREEYSTAHQLLASARSLIVRTGAASADEHARALDAELAEVCWRRQDRAERQGTVQRRRGNDRREAAAVAGLVDENGEPLTPTSAWRAAEELAKLADMKKSLRRVSDLHGFENARF